MQSPFKQRVFLVGRLNFHAKAISVRLHSVEFTCLNEGHMNKKIKMK